MSGEQTTFLASATDATAPAAVAAEQSTAADTAPQAAAGQTAATPGAPPPTETAPVTSGQAEADKPAPVEVKVPEGVEMDGGLLDAIKAGDPQKVVDAYAAIDKQQRDAWDAQGQKWLQEIETDKDLGGTNLTQTKALLAKAVTKFGEPGLIAELDKLGLGNHPGLVRFVARVGKAMAEDTVAGTTAPTNRSSQPDYKGEWFNAPGYEGLNP